MTTMRIDLIALLRPFRGSDVRRLCAFLTLAVGVPRLPFWDIPLIVSPLRFLPSEAFGWTFFVLGIALLATNGLIRYKLSGRMVAFGSLAMWGVLAGATTSITSLLINVIVMWAMVGEIGADRADV